MTSENPNTVFYQVGQSPMGLVAVFSSRATGAHFPACTHIEDVPSGFLATVVHGVANMPLVHTIQGMDETQARQALDAAGFVERPHDMSQAHKAPKRWSAAASAAVQNAQRAPTGFVLGTKMIGPKGDTPLVVFDVHRSNGPDPHDRVWVPYDLLPPAIKAMSRRHPVHELVYHGTEDDARAALLALGLQDDGAYEMYAPEALSFGVMEDTEGFLSPGSTALFILPKDEDCPSFDNLRTSHLKVCPDFIGIDDCENTWTIEGMSPDEVKKALVALGYTHDPELDGDVGG